MLPGRGAFVVDTARTLRYAPTNDLLVFPLVIQGVLRIPYERSCSQDKIVRFFLEDVPWVGAASVCLTMLHVGPYFLQCLAPLPLIGSGIKPE